MAGKAIPTGALLTLWFGGAHAVSVADYVRVCTGDTAKQRSAEVCGCIGNKAKTRFSDAGFEFFVAATAKDRDTSSMLYRKLSRDEIMTATLISMRGPGECEQRRGGLDKTPDRQPIDTEGLI